ncbi:hypothetical protein KKH05_03435 [Patescibacteria group bacterium]|nr:hypothetical protein [Patescibacteria group bacterium]
MKRAVKKHITYRIFILLFIALGAELVITDAVCFAQAGSQKTIAIKTYKMQYAVAAYNKIRTHIFQDLENAAYYLDPAGRSYLYALTCAGGIDMTNISSAGVGSGAYSIDFYTGNGTLLNLTTAGRITMIGGLPDGNAPPIGGKHVYDIAEGMRAKEAAVADVVVISEQEELTVTRSVHKFDTKVAGVISENPRLLLGAAADSQAVALAGIVSCKVTAENGPIQKGDLLVTSSLPGHAMRAGIEEIMPGMVIGTALEALTEKIGKINILVNQ